MSALLLVARNELRKGWLSLVAIGLLVGLTGAAVLGAGSVARRAGTAETRLAAVTNTDDARVLMIGGNSATTLEIGESVLALPGVERGRVARGGVARVEGPEIVYVSAMEGPAQWGDDILSPVLASGRLPDPGRPDEVVMSETALSGAPFDIAIGDTYTLHFLAAEEFARFDASTPLEGTAGTQDVTIVGFVRLIGSGDDLPRIVGTPALADKFLEGMGVLGAALVQLAPDADVDEFVAEVNGLPAPEGRPPELAEFPAATVSNTNEQLQAITRTSTRVLTTGLLLMALVAGVAGLAAVMQTATRHYGAGAAEQRTEVAMGLTMRGRVGARLAAAVPMGIGAGVLAAAGGLAVASISPPGSLRVVEPNPGWAPNVTMIVLGALATTLLTLAVLAWRSARVLRRAGSTTSWREAPMVARMTRRGSRPPTLLGLSMALQPRPGPRGMSARTGIATVAFCLAGVVATMTFAASLHRLVTTPVRFGGANDIVIADTDQALAETFAADPRFSEVVAAHSAGIVIEGRSASGISQTALTGDVHWELRSGRPPATADEIVLGTRLSDELGKGIGDVTILRDADDVDHSLLVVGVGVLPTFGSGEFGRTAAFTPEGLARVASEPPTGELGLTVAPGVSTDDVLAEYSSQYELLERETPRDVSNLSQIDRVPTILGVLLAVLGVVTVLHTSTMVARRGRPDLAISRVLGFTRRQATTSLVVMSLLITLVGALVAIPLGLISGSLIWRLVAEGAAVLGDAVRPWLGVVLLAFAACVGAFVIGLLLSWRERRSRLVETLRSY